MYKYKFVVQNITGKEYTNMPVKLNLSNNVATYINFWEITFIWN